MGANNTGWNMLSSMFSGMEDMLANAFVQDCIRRCGHCQRDVCMECTSQDTLTSNLSKDRLFDCDSGCRCVNCMTKERIDGRLRIHLSSVMNVELRRRSATTLSVTR